MKYQRVIGFLSLMSAFLPGHAFAVIAGTPVKATDTFAKSTVAFLQDTISNTEYPASTELDACSGTLLSDSIYVTAAHCIKESPVGKKLLFAVNIYAAKAPSRVINQYEVNPQFREGYANGNSVPKNNSDIAILHFTGGLPEGYAPAKVLPENFRFTGKETILNGGYGIAEHVKVDSNNTVIDPYAWLGSGILRKTTSAILDPKYAATEIEVKETNTQQAASGDSGGPAFVLVNQELYFVGIDNWGDRARDGTYFEVYADVRAHMTWINTLVKRWETE